MTKAQDQVYYDCAEVDCAEVDCAEVDMYFSFLTFWLF